jgi:hypothetical protein
MTFRLYDRVRETTNTVGLLDFSTNGAVSGYRRFGDVLSLGDTTWYACVLPGGAWEVGIGTMLSGGFGLQRGTILDSSTGSKINFAAGTKDIFIALPASKGNVMDNTFPAGTRIVFQQTNAPLYWTKIIDLDNSALRITSGATGFGGSKGFTTAFAATRPVSNTTLTISQMPLHDHVFNNPQAGGQKVGGTGSQPYDSVVSANTGGQGGSTSHNHTIDIDVWYTDVITAYKN